MKRVTSKRQIKNSGLLSRLAAAGRTGDAAPGVFSRQAASRVSQSVVASPNSAADPLAGSDSQVITAYDDECCQGVVDPLTLATVLAAVAGITFFLRQTAIDTLKKKKRRSADGGSGLLWKGRR